MIIEYNDCFFDYYKKNITEFNVGSSNELFEYMSGFEETLKSQPTYISKNKTEDINKDLIPFDILDGIIAW